MSQTTTLSRRSLLYGLAGGSLAAIALPLRAGATPAEADAATIRFIGSAKPTPGKITLKLPQIAENGNTVQYSVLVDSPMTDADYVKAIHVLADDNPFPEVASFYLSPANGKAEVTARMRMAKTMVVRALAVMSDGSVHEARQEVKVTIGGCGG